MGKIPLDRTTIEGLKRARRTRRYAGKEFRRLTRAWLPLLEAALSQPNPTLQLASAIEKILAHLPDDLRPT